jgi:hypothetical protein
LDFLVAKYAFLPERVRFDAYLRASVQETKACCSLMKTGEQLWTKGQVIVPKWDQRRAYASKRRILSFCSVAMRQGKKPVDFPVYESGKRTRIETNHTLKFTAYYGQITRDMLQTWSGKNCFTKRIRVEKRSFLINQVGP